MHTATATRAVARLALASTLALVLAACDQSTTGPSTPRNVAPSGLHPNKIEGDSTVCISGYIVIDGRIVCN